MKRRKTTSTPKSVIDRGIAQSLEDFKKGRDYGPFDTAEEAIRFLQAMVKKRKGNASKKK